MWTTIRVCRPHRVLQKLNSGTPKRGLFQPSNPNPNPNPTPHDWFNFTTSCLNCVIIFSILWGMESQQQKNQAIQDMNLKIDEICVAYRLLEKRCAPLTRHLTGKRSSSKEQTAQRELVAAQTS